MANWPRDAGFLTAASALGAWTSLRRPPSHLRPLSALSSSTSSWPTSRRPRCHGRCIVAVSEGIHDEKGEAIITKLMGKAQKDAHGNVQLSGTVGLSYLLGEEVKSKLGMKRVRGDTFGYLHGSFVGCVSKVDQGGEAREVGGKAVQDAMAGAGEGSVAICGLGDCGFMTSCALSRSESVAGKTRVMDRSTSDERGRQRRDPRFP